MSNNSSNAGVWVRASERLPESKNVPCRIPDDIHGYLYFGSSAFRGDLSQSQHPKLEWLDEQPIPIPLNKIDDEWIEQIERVLEIEETNIEKAHMQQLIDLLYKYYKTTVLRDDYTQQLKELLLITDCPEILIENPGLFSKKNPDEKAMEWARGKIKVFTDSLSAQQPIPVNQDEKFIEQAEKLVEGVQYLFDMKKEKGSTMVMKNAWNILSGRLYDFKKTLSQLKSSPSPTPNENKKDY